MNGRIFFESIVCPYLDIHSLDVNVFHRSDAGAIIDTDSQVLFNRLVEVT